MSRREIAVSAPGRICLFGEHQDYFGLPIIAAAIDLRIHIRGTPREDGMLSVDLPDIKEREVFPVTGKLTYSRERDYLKSTLNILRRKGVRLDHGWDCLLRGTIPINAGTSSSSALVIAWIKFLLEATGNRELDVPETIAELGFQAEVAEFREPGGKMDHYASSLGGVVAVSFSGGLKAERLPNPLRAFVLADSLQKKDTTGMLGYIKSHVLEGAEMLRLRMAAFDLGSPLDERTNEAMEALPGDHRRLLKGTLLTRDLTARGRALFTARPFDHREFGRLLTRQQEVLREYLRTSTPKIDAMIEAALAAGALGAKINGSGGGGCMFAYAPENAEDVAEALRGAGADARIIRVDEGVRRENPPST